MRVAGTARLPIPIVPLATVVGCPRLLLGLPPETLLIEATLRVTFAPLLPPTPRVVAPEYVFAPLRKIVPPLFAVRFKVPLPPIGPDQVSGELLTPLFRRFRVKVRSARGPARTTGVLASAAKLTPPFARLVQLFGSVIVAPPVPRTGAKVVPLIFIGPVPNELLLLK